MAFLLLMPSYNQARYIADAVQSVLDQDDPDWELWILDNSTDATPDVLRGFGDPRIHFHHIPARMDPGSCLNWMLERAKGEHFSYVHTDNNLHHSYVRQMRRALDGHELGLAYCDMRVIDEVGAPQRLLRRGEFDLPRLLSLDPLGVPFSATTELARRVGGFSVDDTADDVFFCASAYGLAQYAYLPAPLLDYRVHGASRTELSGGTKSMQSEFLGMSARLRPILEARGVKPLDVLADAIAESLDRVDWYLEDQWHRKMKRSGSPWANDRPGAAEFYFAGLLSLPSMPEPGRSPSSANVPGPGRLERIWLRHQLGRRRRHLRALITGARNVLLPWAVMSFGATLPGRRFVVDSLDFRTLWAAFELERSLDWIPLLRKGDTAPSWLRWGTSTGSEPAIDLRNRPTLIS